MYIIAGKKSASWQLVAVGEGSKTTQKGAKIDVKLHKISPKSKEPYRAGVTDQKGGEDKRTDDMED